MRETYRIEWFEDETPREYKNLYNGRKRVFGVTLGGVMDHFDRPILEFFNRFSQKSWTFDTAICLLAGTDLLKGGMVAAILWALWFTRGKERDVAETRRTLLATVAGTFVALFLARVLQKALPFRFRPLLQPVLNFRIPFGIPEGVHKGWSSFPSDHAALFAGLVTGIFLISRRLGIFSIIYVFLVILIPRIYLGLHYPTDIIGGILLGIICVLLANVSMIKKPVSDPLLEWSEKNPPFFYGVFFLVTYQLASLFWDVRAAVMFLLGVAKTVLHKYF